MHAPCPQSESLDQPQLGPEWSSGILLSWLLPKQLWDVTRLPRKTAKKLQYLNVSSWLPVVQGAHVPTDQTQKTRVLKCT